MCVFFLSYFVRVQVSAAFDRVSDIKLVPNLRKALPWRGKGSGEQRNAKKRYEVREILLEDVCICVDAGVWNDLLGDHVGAVFSPQFCLGVKVGPQVRAVFPFWVVSLLFGYTKNNDREKETRLSLLAPSSSVAVVAFWIQNWPTAIKSRPFGLALFST